MNKNLETEYKNLAKQEAINIDANALWNRIEAALPEKESISEESAKEEIHNNIVPITNTKKKWYKNSQFVSLAGTVAAACVLALILLSNRNSLVKNESSHFSKQDTVAEESINVTDNGTSERFEDLEEATTDSVNSSDAFVNDSANEIQSDGKGAYEEVSDTNLNIYSVDFVVMGIQGEYLECVVTVSNELMPEGTEFFLEYNEVIKDYENELSMDLILDKTVDGKYYFSF